MVHVFSMSWAMLGFSREPATGSGLRTRAHVSRQRWRKSARGLTDADRQWRERTRLDGADDDDLQGRQNSEPSPKVVSHRKGDRW